MKVSVLSICVILLYLDTVSTQSDTSTLKLAQVLTRHGDRTPTEDYPNNPYTEDDWPNGFEQLTQKGMRQMRDLGKFLRMRYDGYMNDTYITREVYVRSSDKDRTLMSAETLLAGLYPPKGFQKWDGPETSWQPIPIHTQPYDYDIEMTVDVNCPKYSLYYVKALMSDELQQLEKENKAMIDYVTEQAGWPVSALPNMWDTFDPLFCAKQHPELGLPQPAWVTPTVYNWLEERHNDYYFFRAFTPEMSLLHTGHFLKMLTDRMKEKVSGEMDPKLKMYLYSSHDSMISAIMYALDIWNGIKPPYASAYLFELHQSPQQDFFVRIYYKNDTMLDYLAEPYPIELPGCQVDCPFNDFMSLLKPKVYKGTVKDWVDECNSVLPQTTDEPEVSAASITVTVLAVVIVVILAIIFGYCIKRHTTRQAYDTIPNGTSV